MDIRTIAGRKAPGDRVILVKTRGEEQISFLSIFTILSFLFLNEDRCYPKGKGRLYLMEAIQEIYKGVSPYDVVQKYGGKG